MAALATFGAGLCALLVAGHFLVRAATSIGNRLGMSPMVIGMTIVAAGTSAPELAVVAQSIAADDTEIAVGGIIGSNIANVLLVLGLTALMGTTRVDSRTVRIDIPVMIAASAALLVLSLDGILGRVDGLVLGAGCATFITWTVRSTRREAADQRSAELGRPLVPPGHIRPLVDYLRPLTQLGLSVAALPFAARLVVGGAEDLATALSIPELIIGLTLVALGTSAPEIATSLIASARGRRDLAVGTAVGSNIFNLLLVLGISSFVAPGGISVSDDALQLDLPIMVAAAIACLPIVAWDHKLDRWEGAVFVAYYVAYLVFLALDGTGHRARDPFALVMGAFVFPLTVVTAATIIGRHHRRGTGHATAESPASGSIGSEPKT